MVDSMKVDGARTFVMGKGLNDMQMVIPIMANLRMERHMGKGSIRGKMGRYMMVNGTVG